MFVGVFICLYTGYIYSLYADVYVTICRRISLCRSQGRFQ